MTKIVTQLVRTRRDTMSIRLRFCIDRARLRKNPLLDVVPMRNLLEKGHVVLTSYREYVRRKAGNRHEPVSDQWKQQLETLAEKDHPRVACKWYETARSEAFQRGRERREGFSLIASS